MGIVAVSTISRGRTVGNCSRNILEKKRNLQSPDLATKWRPVLDVYMDFVERNYTKCSAMWTLDKNFACLGVIYKEMWQHEDEYSCRGGPTKAATLLQQVVVDLFVCIK